MKPNIIKKVCPICSKEFYPDRNSRIFCSRECYNKSLTFSYAPSGSIISKDNIELVINNYNTISDLAQHFNVSRPTMRKYLNQYGLLYNFKAKYDYRAKSVLQYDANMNFIKEWPSARDAIKTTGIKDIDKCVLLKQKSAGGYI